MPRRYEISRLMRCCCNALQHTATHCNTPQHTATHCNTLQHTATHVIFTHGHNRQGKPSKKEIIALKNKYVTKEKKQEENKYVNKILNYFAPIPAHAPPSPILPFCSHGHNRQRDDDNKNKYVQKKFTPEPPPPFPPSSMTISAKGSHIILQHTATHLNAKLCNARSLHPEPRGEATETHCNTLQHAATHCSTWQHS